MLCRRASLISPIKPAGAFRIDYCKQALSPWPGTAEDRKGPLFCTASGDNSNALSDHATDRSVARRIIQRRAVAARIHAPIGNYTLPATGITALNPHSPDDSAILSEPATIEY